MFVAVQVGEGLASELAVDWLKNETVKIVVAAVNLPNSTLRSLKTVTCQIVLALEA